MDIFRLILLDFYKIAELKNVFFRHVFFRENRILSAIFRHQKCWQKIRTISSIKHIIIFYAIFRQKKANNRKYLIWFWKTKIFLIEILMGKSDFVCHFFGIKNAAKKSGQCPKPSSPSNITYKHFWRQFPPFSVEKNGHKLLIRFWETKIF